MPHDFRTVALSILGAPQPAEHSLWVLTKDGRRVEARTQMRPVGAELHIYCDGAMLRSEVVRDGRNVGDVAEAAKADWLTCGWVAE